MTSELITGEKKGGVKKGGGGNRFTEDTDTHQRARQGSKRSVTGPSNISDALEKKGRDCDPATSDANRRSSYSRDHRGEKMGGANDEVIV